MKNYILTSLIFSLFLGIGIADAMTYTVCPNLTYGCDYTDIQEAINAASDQDSIEIWNSTSDPYGRYSIPDKTIIVNKSLDIYSRDGYDVTKIYVWMDEVFWEPDAFNIEANNVTIAGLTIMADGTPISSVGFNYINISNNIIPTAGDESIVFINVNYSTITDNNVSYKVWIQDSFNNSIYHNNILGGAVEYYTGNNSWDNGYPSGGNWWEGTNCIDLYRGEYQNETAIDGILAPDGICDSPKTFNYGAQDKYPFVNVNGWEIGIIPICQEGDTVIGTCPDSFEIITHNCVNETWVRSEETCRDVPETLTVCSEGCNFTVIQDAVDHTLPGDTIYVYNGTYGQAYISEKSNLSIIGGNRDLTEISSVSVYRSSNIALSTFTVRNTGACISLTSVNKTILEDINVMSCSGHGINLDGSRNSTIRNNYIYNSQFGIRIPSSDNITIENNNITYNHYGIFISSPSSGNLITNNRFSDNVDLRDFNPEENTWVGNTYASPVAPYDIEPQIVTSPKILGLEERILILENVIQELEDQFAELKEFVMRMYDKLPQLHRKMGLKNR